MSVNIRLIVDNQAMVCQFTVLNPVIVLLHRLQTFEWIVYCLFWRRRGIMLWKKSIVSCKDQSVGQQISGERTAERTQVSIV